MGVVQRRFIRWGSVRNHRKKLIFLQVSLLIFPLGRLMLKQSNNELKKEQQEENHKVFCMNGRTAIFSPSAEGLIMKTDIRPEEWRVYESSLHNTTDQRIFFHETSGHTELSLKQCCAVESAAKHNPDRAVYLFVRSSTECIFNLSDSSTLLSADSPSWLKVFSRYPNIIVVLLNEDRYFAGTPLENWYRKGEWHSSKFRIGHLSDYIRILTLYKGGGLYLDLDILTLKPFKGRSFHNCLVYENPGMDTISNSIMHLEHGHKVTKELIKLLSEEYDPNSYAYHGPDAIGVVMSRVCGLTAGNPKSNKCDDITLLSHRSFHPVAAMFSHMLFQNDGNRSDLVIFPHIKDSYGLHLWNSISRLHERLDISSYQTVAVLARRHCPLCVSRVSDFTSL